MDLALAHAVRGLGYVEPNPMVGCVLVKPNDSGGELISEGFHQNFGGPHAEIVALEIAGERARGSTAYVTLEPCAHHGKTGPCAEALIAAGVSRAVVATMDPFEKVAGQGVAKLRDAGVTVDIGICEDRAKDVLAPFLKRVATGIPWIIAKWAMTWDGKIAAKSGDSQWISNNESRQLVHDLRGRADAIMVGSKTANADDPLLTARPAGIRTATRVVVDSKLSLDLESQLVKTAMDVPVLVCAGADCDGSKRKLLAKAGVEVWANDADDETPPLLQLLRNFGDRDFTNVLVEGGGGLLGALFDLQQIDEVHCFLGPKIVGGELGISPVAGEGVASMVDASELRLIETRKIGQDILMIGRIQR